MKKPTWVPPPRFLKGSDGLQRNMGLQQPPSRLPTTATLSPHLPLTTTQKYIFSFSRTREASSQWLTEMENRFQIYLRGEVSIFLKKSIILKNNELWGHGGLVLFPAYRDSLTLEEKVTNEQDILILVMCFSHFNVSWTTKMFIFLSSLLLGAQEE